MHFLGAWISESIFSGRNARDHMQHITRPRCVIPPDNGPHIHAWVADRISDLPTTPETVAHAARTRAEIVQGLGGVLEDVGIDGEGEANFRVVDQLTFDLWCLSVAEGNRQRADHRGAFIALARARGWDLREAEDLHENRRRVLREHNKRAKEELRRVEVEETSSTTVLISDDVRAQDMRAGLGTNRDAERARTRYFIADQLGADHERERAIHHQAYEHGDVDAAIDLVVTPEAIAEHLDGRSTQGTALARGRALLLVGAMRCCARDARETGRRFFANPGSEKERHLEERGRREGRSCRGEAALGRGRRFFGTRLLEEEEKSVDLSPCRPGRGHRQCETSPPPADPQASLPPSPPLLCEGEGPQAGGCDCGGGGFNLGRRFFVTTYLESVRQREAQDSDRRGRVCGAGDTLGRGRRFFGTRLLEGEEKSVDLSRCPQESRYPWCEACQSSAAPSSFCAHLPRSARERVEARLRELGVDRADALSACIGEARRWVKPAMAAEGLAVLGWELTPGGAGWTRDDALGPRGDVGHARLVRLERWCRRRRPQLKVAGLWAGDEARPQTHLRRLLDVFGLKLRCRKRQRTEVVDGEKRRITARIHYLDPDSWAPAWRWACVPYARLLGTETPPPPPGSVASVAVARRVLTRRRNDHEDSGESAGLSEDARRDRTVRDPWLRE